MTCGVGFRKSMIVVLACMCRLCIVCAFWDMKHQSTEFRSRHHHVCMYVCMNVFVCFWIASILYVRTIAVHVKYYTLAMADNYTTIQQQKPQTITTKPNTRPSKQQQQSNNQAFSHCWRNDKPKPNRCSIIAIYPAWFQLWNTSALCSLHKLFDANCTYPMHYGNGNCTNAHILHLFICQPSSQLYIRMQLQCLWLGSRNTHSSQKPSLRKLETNSYWKKTRRTVK